jgi:uncharacterized protein
MPAFAGKYPAIESLIARLDEYLKREHPTWFGPDAKHPVLPVKRSKVIHDNLWGTNRYSWRELVLLDSPLLQRLRDIHQVGLAFQIYPSAHHTRFDHSLGVTTIAARVFDSLLSRNRGQLRDIASAIYKNEDRDSTIAKFKQELRLAALLHDTGHSLFSHASERVYEKLDVLTSAAAELRKITGKKKGSGEAISFCFALTPSVAQLLDRVKGKLTGPTSSEDYDGDIDLMNVAMLIVGKSTHPFLQFLGDIISSGFDADKLDYLLRDAKAAGLPLQYDLDRYLYAVQVSGETLGDGDGYLENLYNLVAPAKPERRPAAGSDSYPYYDTYRVRLPRQAMNAIEQIVICKLMLFSYIYHHAKVRSGEGTLTLMLGRQVHSWRASGEDDGKIVERFLTMTDSALRAPTITESNDPIVRDYAYRIANRLLPREVLRLSVALATGTDRVHVGALIEQLHDSAENLGELSDFEKQLATELRKTSSLGGSDQDVLHQAGVWVDVPKPPKFEDVDKMVIRGDNGADVHLTHLFPINQWTEAYTHYRYHVRLFAFSEYHEAVAKAARKAIEVVAKIENAAFYSSIIRVR